MKSSYLLVILFVAFNSSCNAGSQLVSPGLYAIETFDALDEGVDLKDYLPSKADFKDYKNSGICFTQNDVGSLEEFSLYTLKESIRKTCKVIARSKNSWSTTCEELNKPKFTYEGRIQFDGNRFASVIVTKFDGLVIPEISRGYLIKEKCN